MGYQDWVQSYEKSQDQTITDRRHLHQYPELSFEETKTKQYILSQLRTMGYADIIDIPAGGLVVVIGGKKPGPVIALRADYDALAITEEVDVAFKSVNEGVMHACGHDGHTASLLGVARALVSDQDALNGTLKLIFQHAEELPPGGAVDILKSGVLDDVDFIYGIHLRGDWQYDGSLQVCSGYAMAASDLFEITIQGKGGHGASPHETYDPTVAGAFLITQLQTLISRNKDPLKAGVLTTAIFQSKSMTANIIADSAFLKGTVRTFDPELRNLMQTRIQTMAESVAQGFGCSATVSYTRGYPALYNHPEQTELVAALFEGNVTRTQPRMGGEDFAYYLEKIPGSFFFVKAGRHEKNYPHHHPKFEVDERSLDVSVLSFLKIIDYYLGKEDQGYGA